MAKSAIRFKPQNYTLLVASGDALLRQSIVAKLEAAGYHASSMNSHKQVMNALSVEHYDMFIVDSMLDGTKGEQLILELRKMPGTTDIPILKFVDKNDQLGGNRVLKAGATSFFRKPPNLADLVENVTELLNATQKQSRQQTVKIVKPPKNTYVILVVDDEEMNRNLLARRLKREGFKTDEAASGKEALEKLNERPFDLVLLDIMMPEMDGYEVLARIKMYDVLKNIPVIMVSALNDAETVKQCMHIGVDGYITKPFDFAQVREKIRACLGIIR